MMQGYLAHLIEEMLWFSIYIPRMTIEKDKKTIIYKKDNSGAILMMNLEMISILIIQLWIDIFQKQTNLTKHKKNCKKNF